MSSVRHISLFSLVILISAFFTNCNLKNQVEPELKKLDSLQIVLKTKITELNKCDTVLLNKAIVKFSNYSTYIENNLSDTVTKTEANGLQQFYISANNLKSFAVNRSSLNNRASLVTEQIKNLINDLNNNIITKDEFLKSYDTETKAAIQLIALTEQEIQNYSRNIQDFKNSLFPVETLIKSTNSGLLPAAFNDTVCI